LPSLFEFFFLIHPGKSKQFLFQQIKKELLISDRKSPALFI